MERRFFLMIGALLGVALVLATATIVTTQAFAASKSHGPVCPPDCNGVRGDHTNNGNHFGQLANGPTGAIAAIGQDNFNRG